MSLWKRMIQHASAGAAGGMFGLALVGLIEAAVVLWQSQTRSDLGAVPWALLAYGIFGALGGAGLGAAVGLFAHRGLSAFGGYLALFFFVGASIIGRFRVIRDVFNERMPQGLVPLLGQLAALVGLALIALAIFRLGRRVASHPVGERLTRPIGAGVTLALMVAAGAALATLPRFVPESGPGPSARAPSGAPPIFLLMVDTLRADHLSCHGSTRVRTPNVDRLAADGIRFDAAIAQASWTRPSVATILTGMYPSSHGAVHKGDILADSVVTLAEALQARGYRTIGLPNNANVTEAFNFQQGFDRYLYLAPDLFFYATESAAELVVYKQLRLLRERFASRGRWVQHYYQPAEEVTDQALRLAAREAGGPFFLYVHYMDPHDPYFAHPFNGVGLARVATPSPDPARVPELQRLYEGEVAYLDAQLGRLFDGLRAQGLYDRALILLTSDHGEEFYEHGGWWHGTTLYEEQINVPFIVKPPAPIGGGRVATGLVRSLDIAPTLLAAAGAAIPKEMQGRAIDLTAPDDSAASAVYSEEALEGNVIRAVRTAAQKLIEANEDNPRGQPSRQFFDLRADPLERDNLFGKGHGGERALAAELARLAEEAGRYARASQQRSIDSATQERLKALGYVE